MAAFATERTGSVLAFTLRIRGREKVIRCGAWGVAVESVMKKERPRTFKVDDNSSIQAIRA